MITDEELRNLLSEPESPRLDFKRDAPKLDNEGFRASFIKDVLAMANTPREGTAYIIYGVDLQPDGSKVWCGVHPFVDDADLQQY